MSKFIWALIGLNTIGLLIFIASYFVLTQGRNVDYQEKGWTVILSITGLLVILLAAIPLRYGHGTGWVIFSAFFAALPLFIASSVFVSRRLSSLKRKQSYAQTYYKDKNQRRIAAAIEENDTSLLKELIKGQDLNIQGTRVWDVDGLNYLQFAIRLRNNPISFPFDEEANTAAIRILIENGSLTTPALAEASQYLSAEKLLMLLNAGADPNCPSFTEPAPLLFEVIGNNSNNEIPVLLIQKGADVNALKDKTYTPVMYAACRAGTSQNWHNAWPLVRYMLEDAKADYSYTSKDGSNLQGIMKNIRGEAIEKNITMPADFNYVLEWLAQHETKSSIL